MAKIEKVTPELDPKKELERQLGFLEESNYKEQNPIKYASRKAELEAKLEGLKPKAKEPEAKPKLK